MPGKYPAKGRQKEEEMAGQVYHQIREIMECAYELADRSWVMEQTKELWERERPQTFSAYSASAQYVYELLKENGFAAEKLTFPADGRTVYQDKRSPLAWDASVGRLTVMKSPVAFADPVVADFEKMPLNLIKHSVATPEGGIYTRLLTESQVYAGADCTGAMVLLEPDTAPISVIGYNIAPLLDLGALGFVSDYLTGGIETPDSVQWVNSGTERSNWHVQEDDRDFIAFSVSPRTGRKLREAALRGNVEVLVECDGRRCEGEVNAVTALLPGRQKKELWIIGHLYEPFADDNSAGVIGAISVLKEIREMTEKGILPPLNFSVRLVFAMELYGFAAVAEHFGGYLGDRVIGGINMDGLCIPKREQAYINTVYGPLATPFFGNFIMKTVVETFRQVWSDPAITEGRTLPGDDTFLGDASVGAPILWPICAGPHLWHNSSQDMEYIDEERFVKNIALFTTWAGLTATVNEENLSDYLEEALAWSRRLLEKTLGEEVYIGCRKERTEYFHTSLQQNILSFAKACDSSAVYETAQQLKCPAVTEEDSAEPDDSVWLSYAENIIPERTHTGFPQDLVKLPKEKRKRLPDNVLYGPMALILSNMDGRKNLKQLICEAVWEKYVPADSRRIKGYVDAVQYLAEAGYLKAQNKAVLTKEMIVRSLKETGVCEGDVLLVHSSQSGLGYIEGGADTIIDALMEAVGETGTILMPNFITPYLQFEGSINTGRDYRPKLMEEAADVQNAWTGEVPKKLYERAGAVRSAHCSHAWCGLGAKAEECLKHHALLDPPAGENSPMAYALKEKGKVLFFGCDIASNTFLHYVEDRVNADFLENAVVKIMEKDGRFRTEVVKKHLPGHREFYRRPAMKNAFYQKALAKGLKIRQQELGIGMLSLMELENVYQVSMEMFAEDPNATLCEDPGCMFCASYRRKMKR